MGRKNRRQLAALDVTENARHCKQTHAYWKNALEEFCEYDIGNPTGRSRTKEENRLILCAIRSNLRTYLEMVDNKQMKIEDVTWTNIYNKVSTDFQIRRTSVEALHLNFIEEEGDVLVFGKDNKRGPKVEVHRVLDQEVVQCIVDLVDTKWTNNNQS
jgi:hypothetical protein